MLRRMRVVLFQVINQTIFGWKFSGCNKVLCYAFKIENLNGSRNFIFIGIILKYSFKWYFRQKYLLYPVKLFLKNFMFLLLYVRFIRKSASNISFLV